MWEPLALGSRNNLCSLEKAKTVSDLAQLSVQICKMRTHQAFVHLLSLFIYLQG